MRGGRFAIVAVLVVLVALVGAGGARACSCAPTPPARSLAAADAALVGRLLSVRPRGAARAEYRYEVLRVYRGSASIATGSVLKVESPRGAAACSLPDRLGRAYGLFLLGEPGRWASGLCGVVSPRRLRAAALHSGGGGDGAAAAISSCAS